MLLLLVSSSVSAQPKSAIADDGREVRLNEDGSWEFVSEDRFATTDDGARVRLRQDGTWQPAEVWPAEVWPAEVRPAEARMAPATAAHADRVAHGQMQESETVSLDRVVIESIRSTRHKNSRVESQMVFHLGLRSAEKLDLSALSGNDFVVTDSRGRLYEVTSVSVTEQQITAQGHGSIVLRVADSPRWWGNRFFQVDIDSGTLGTARPLQLTMRMSDVIRRDVDELSR